MRTYHEEIHQDLVTADIKSKAEVDAQAALVKGIEPDSIQHHADAKDQDHAINVDGCHNEANGCHCLQAFD